MFRTVCALCVVVFAGAAPIRASAQLHVEDTTKPFLQPDRLDRFTERLDDNRAAVIDTLFEDYRSELAEAWQRFEEQRAALIDRTHTPDGESASASFFQLRQEQRRFAQQRFARFVDDVRSVLRGDDTRRSEWELCLQKQWRERLLKMIAPGARLGVADLSTLTDEFDLTPDERATLKPVLPEYMSALDEILKRFEDGFVNAEKEMEAIRAALSHGEANAVQRHRELIDWYASFGRDIAELNERFAPRIESALSPANRLAWQSTSGASLYQPLFEMSPLDHFVDLFRRHADLPPELQTDVILLYEEYRARRLRLRARAYEVLSEWMDSEERAELEREFMRLIKARNEGDQTIDPLVPFAANPILPFLDDLQSLERQATDAIRRRLGQETESQLSLPARWTLHWYDGLDEADADTAVNKRR